MNGNERRINKEWFRILDIFLLCLILVAACVGPILVYRRLAKRVQNELAQLTRRVDKSLAAGAKLLEVRNYYEQTSAELKKMLDEAYKEGNRFRQDQLRKMIERLDTLRTRTLDKTVSMLDFRSGQSPRKRRRRSRRPRRKPKPPSSKPSE